MCDKSDQNETETALREAEEEIGLKRDQLHVLAQLCPLITSTGVLVTPVVAYFDHMEFEPKINKDEVEMIFELPTQRFITNNDHSVKSVELKNNDEYFLHSFHDKVNDEIIKTWGVTALIGIVVSTILARRAPNFIVDPKFGYRNDNVNDYLDFNVLKNVERIKNVTKRNKE